MLLVGVDGGGSGCRVALADATGRRLATSQGGAANIASDRERALENILATISDAAERHGGAGALTRSTAVLGLAGANVGDHADWIAARLPFARSVIVSDARIALAGAHAGEDGIVAIVGTGSAFAMQRGGVFSTFGGWGLALGDEAGGAWLGRAAMARALHMADGLRPSTPLLEAIVNSEGGPEALSARSGTMTPEAFARRAPEVIAAAEAADPAARDILSEAEDYLMHALDLLLVDAPLPIAFLGGLGDVYARRLASRYGALIRGPKGNALDGALQMALDRLRSEAGA